MRYMEPAGKVVAERILTRHSDHSDIGTYIDKLWADLVILWRDVLHPDLLKE